MLVLSRRIGETLVMTLPDGSRVTVMVTDISCGTVKLQIGAPRQVPILRSELLGRTSHDRR